MSDDELEALLQNPAIVRNRRKIYVTRSNAQVFMKVQEASVLLMLISGLGLITHLS